MASVDIGNVNMRSKLFALIFAGFMAGVTAGGAVVAGIGTAYAQPIPVDKIVALVDEDVVLQSEFDVRWAQVQEQIAKATGPVPPTAELRKQVLDQIIIEHLQLQMANRAGIRVDDNQLNTAMSTIAQQNQMTFEQFTEVLQQQGLYDSTREALRKEIIIGQFQNGAVNRRIEISRQEVENFLRSETGLTETAPEYHVAHILIPNNGDAATDRQRELADVLYTQLMEGNTSVAELVARKEINGMTISGGDLGWSKPEGLPSVFATVVPALEAGEVSKPFTSPNGYHIVQVLELRGGTALKLNQAKVRHILVKPNEIRTEAQTEALIRALYQRIKDGEDFEDIARQNSDDENSIVAGGNLDWVYDGMVPADFMSAVNATATGEISEPFRAQTGWHIVEVLDRRIQDVTEENKRFQAENILRQRKFDNELEDWLTEIRDTSYIDIKDF
jgi:peptidyl-prolyl cis-trans isomerase SurA